MRVKRFFVVTMLCLLALMPKVWADGPDDQYVTIYNMIQQGDMYLEKGQTASARAKYEDALSVLKKFQAVYPDWNGKVVRYRLTYLSEKLTELGTNAPPVKPATAATNKPATTPTTPAPVTTRTNVPAATTPTNVPAPTNVPPPTNAPEKSSAASAPKVVVTPKPEVAPAVAATLSPAKAAAPANNSDYQVMALQDQVRRLEGDKVVLEAKLKEALSARPASVDPRELAQAQELVRELQKENELLKASLAEARTNSARAGSGTPEQTRSALAEANRKVALLTEANAVLSRDKEALQARVKVLANPDAVTQALREENEILKRQVAELRGKAGANSPTEDLNRKLMEAQSQLAVLQSDKDLLRLEKTALETRYKEMETRANAPLGAAVAMDAVTVQKIKLLESQRDELQVKLDAALHVIEGHQAGTASTAQVEQMTQKLSDLHARIETLEAKPIPYTPEELAMFDKPAVVPRQAANPHDAKRSVRELPASAAVLIAEAKRFYASGELDKSEAKYLEVLKLNEKNVSTLADLATVQLELNHLGDAEKHIKSALAIEPDNDYSLVVLGRLKYQQTNYDAALDAFSRAAQINPQSAEIQNFLGITLSDKGLRVPAEAALRRAVTLDPTYASAQINLAFVYALEKPPLVELARLHYQKALASHHPRDMRLEALLDPPKNATPTP